MFVARTDHFAVSLIEFSWPTRSIAELAAFIFFLRLLDVSLGTLRLIMIARGKRSHAAVLGFFEITIWIVAVARVLNDIANIWLVLAYSSGYAAGTALGIWIENRFTESSVMLRIASPKNSALIANWLRAKEFRVMQMQGASIEGPVQLILSMVDRRRLANTVREIQSIDSNAEVTVEDLRFVAAGKTAR